MNEMKLITSSSISESQLSVSECLWACQSKNGCLAVSYAFSGEQCLLHTVNQFSSGVTVSAQTGWDYFELHCGK